MENNVMRVRFGQWRSVFGLRVAFGFGLGRDDMVGVGAALPYKTETQHVVPLSRNDRVGFTT